MKYHLSHCKISKELRDAYATAAPPPEIYERIWQGIRGRMRDNNQERKINRNG